MNRTPRFALPFISPGQAQKELLHNEALQTVDMLLACAVEELPRASPPETPEIGSCYIVAAEAVGDWAGREGCLAAYSSGGWRLIAPREGMTVYVRASGVFGLYRTGSWEFGAVRCSSLIVEGEQVVGPQSPPIASPAGGATIDSAARAAIDQILAALRSHGLVKT